MGLTLHLTHVDLEDGVEYLATVDDAPQRPVTVRVGSGRSWLDACLFPHARTEAGESLGEPYFRFVTWV